uniref:Uncharacterized protein n=1 Tax=Globodera rostochiensis TaxID=31243 RepID=A0A914HSG0_GLORO
MPPPALAEQLQQQQQMLGTILEEDWMDDDILCVEEEEQRRRAFRTEQMKQQQWYLDGSGRRGGRVGRMVDWWMGRGERWPDHEQQQQDGVDAQKLEEMVTLAKTTIELTPPLRQVREGAKHHGMCRGDNKNLNNNASPTRSPIGKRSTTLSLQNRSGASTEMPLNAAQNEQCHGSEVNVSLQVVREHNITVSASCCFAEQKMPLLTSAREMMPLCRPNMSSNGSRTEMRKSTVNDRASVKKLGLRMVDIQLEDGLDDCHWGQKQCCDGVSNNNVTVWAVGTNTDMSRPSRSISLASTNKSPPKKQKQTAQQCIVSSQRKGNESRKDERAEGQHGAAPAAAQQTTTGWTQFKRDREQRESREHAAVAHYRHLPKSCPSHLPAPTFSSSSSHSSNFSSSSSPSLSLLSPLCSPPPLLPWLNNISNGSSSGVGSSVSSVSPKSTDGEGERDGQALLANGRMEQFRHATSMHRRQNNGAGGDYRVISLDMRPEPGRLEDFVPEVERAKAAAVTKIGNRRTNAATAALSDESAFDARTVREERNYDLQRMDCLRRSWQRRVSTTAVVGGRGGGTLPAVKRNEAEVDDEEATLRRDEWGRVIVGQREWRQFMAEQRTPSNRRVKSQIRLLNDNNGRKTPTIVTMDDGRTAEEEEEAAQEEQFSQLNEEKRFDNGTCPPAVGQAALLRISWQRDECGVNRGTKLGRTVQMPPAHGNGHHGWPISTIFGGFPSTNFDYHHHHTVDGMTRK